MVKTRQKNLRAFIFLEGETQETIAYIEKNLVLLQNLVLMFDYSLRGDKIALYHYLVEKQLNFIESDTHNFHWNIQRDLKGSYEKNTTKVQQDNQEEVGNKEKTLVLNRMVRSGEEIISAGDLTIFGRINSGASIQSSGNVQIFGEINGNVFCDGDYMILGNVKEGNILFQGEIIEKELFKYPYNKVYKKKNLIVIEELK